MNQKVQFLIFFWLSLTLVNTAFLAVAVLLFRRSGVPIERIKLFFGPALFTRMRGETEYSLGCIPYGGFAKYEMEAFSTAPRAVRMGSSLIPVVATLLVTMALLGPSDAIHSVASGFAQIIDGALHPVTDGVNLLRRLAELTENPVRLAGIVAAKAVALSLFPLPVLPGGKWLVDIYDPKSETKVVELLATVCALACIGAQISWLIAGVLFLWRD